MNKRVGFSFRTCLKCGCYTNANPGFCMCETNLSYGSCQGEATTETHEKLFTPLTDEQIDQACDEAYPLSEEEIDRLGDDLTLEESKKAATILRQEVRASAAKRMKETGEVKMTMHQPLNYRTSSQDPNMANQCKTETIFTDGFGEKEYLQPEDDDYEWQDVLPCPRCNGSGKEPSIIQVEEVCGGLASNYRPDVDKINEQANQALGLPPKILQGESNFASHAEDHLDYMSRSGTFLPVRTKRDFVRRYEKNEFGNRAPTWNTLEEFLASEYTGLIHLRNRIAGGLTWYNVAANDVDLYWQNALNTGLRPTDLYISGMCPTERTVLQGEVMQSELGGLNLYYTRVAKPMREALKEDSHTVVGSIAQKFLEYYFCPASYEWMQVLLERYPSHVLEFTALDVCWGTIPNQNVLWWEVRLY